MLNIYKKLALIITLSAFLLVPMAAAVASAASPPHSLLAVDVLNPSCTSGTTTCSGACNNPDATSRPAICADNSAGSNTNPVFGPSGILTIGVKVVSWIVGVLATIIIIISGLRMIVASGDSNSINSARNGIIYALIGLIVAASAQILVAFVLDRIG